MKWLKPILVVALVLVLAGGVVFAIASEPRPEGIEGPEADALARKIEAAVGIEAWKNVGAVSFKYANRRTFLWDRKRNVVRVDFDDHRVYLDIEAKKGRAFTKNLIVSDEQENAKLVDKADSWFVNDTFWLNPFAGFFDRGVTRTLVDGALFISYAKGGRTPGDAYLWIPDETGLPKAGKMWVGMLPIGGLDVTWEKYVDLGGGAKVATWHKFIRDIAIDDLKSGDSAIALEPGADPFLPLN